MVHIIRSIDLISHSDRKHYTSMRQYERALEAKGQHIMSDREYKDMRDMLRDGPATKKEPQYNHVHIDMNTGKVEKQVKENNDK